MHRAIGMSSKDSDDGGSPVAAASSTDDGDKHKSTVETHPRTESPVPLEVCCYWSQHRHSHVLTEAVRVSSACCFVRSCASKRNAMTSCWKLASRWVEPPALLIRQTSLWTTHHLWNRSSRLRQKNSIVRHDPLWWHHSRMLSLSFAAHGGR